MIAGEAQQVIQNQLASSLANLKHQNLQSVAGQLSTYVPSNIQSQVPS